MRARSRDSLGLEPALCCGALALLIAGGIAAGCDGGGGGAGGSGGNGATSSSSGTGGASSSSSSGTGGGASSSSNASSSSGMGGGGASSASSSSSSSGMGGGGASSASSSSSSSSASSASSSSSSSSSSSGAVGGDPVWVKVFPQDSAQFPPYDVGVYSVATDGAGDIVLSGRVDGQMNFEAITITSAMPGSGYAAKFTVAGSPLWAKVVTGATEGGSTNYISANAAGKIAMAGNGNGLQSFGYAHYWKFEPTGSEVFHKQWNGGLSTSFTASPATIADSGHVYATGSLAFGSIDFGGGTVNMPGFYLIKYDPSGAYLWHKTLSSEPAIDAAGNAYVSAFPGEGACPAGNLAKLDPSGNCIWSKKFTGNVPALRHAVNAAGEVILTGTYASSLFDLGCGQMSSIPTALVVAKFDPSGTCVWAKNFTGNGFQPPPAPAEPMRVVPTGSGQWLLGMKFQGSLDLGGGPITPGSDTVFVKLDAAGAYQWHRQFAGAATGLLAGDPSGAMILAGLPGSTDLGSGPLLVGSGVILAKFAP